MTNYATPPAFAFAPPASAPRYPAPSSLKAIGADHNSAPTSKEPNRDRNPQSRSALSVLDSVTPPQGGPLGALVDKHLFLASTAGPEGYPVFATVTDRGEDRVWKYRPPTDDDKTALLAHLWDNHCRRVLIITWNGLASAFHALHRYCDSRGERLLLQDVALAHIDAGFALLCETGHRPPGLLQACHCLGLCESPASQDPAERAVRHAYDLQSIYARLLETGYLHWCDLQGQMSRWWPIIIYDGPQPRLLTAREALEQPVPPDRPDRRPQSRARYLSWLARTAA